MTRLCPALSSVYADSIHDDSEQSRPAPSETVRRAVDTESNASLMVTATGNPLRHLSRVRGRVRLVLVLLGPFGHNSIAVHLPRDIPRNSVLASSTTRVLFCAKS